MSFQALDKDGAPVTIQNPTLGPKAGSDSLPVALSTEDKTALDIVATGTGTPADAAYSGTGSSTIISVLKWIGGLLVAVRDGIISLNSYPSTYAPSKLVSAAASTNATVAKASGGGVTFISGYNANAAARYLKLYNKATAPTVGTDVPTHVFRLPPSSDFMFDFSNPLIFATGISYALTTGSADNDTGALTAADVLCLMVGTI